MPELPEVEVLKQSLNKNIKLKKIKKIKINNVNLRFKVPKSLNKIFKGQVIKNISRISKYLILHFKIDKKILIHLGMSGTIHLVRKKNHIKTNASFYHSFNLPKKHNHIEMTLNNNLKLIYNDPRRFGYFKLIGSNFINEPPLNKLGLDPFNSSFNFQYFHNYIKNKKKNVKNLLMDQTFVAGIGNIYANEILFYCKLSPFKNISKLNKKDIFLLLKNIKKVLKKAIFLGGSTIRDFKKIDGKVGNFQQNFKVYGKNKIKCPKHGCHAYIKRTIISQRSAFYCPKCQN